MYMIAQINSHPLKSDDEDEYWDETCVDTIFSGFSLIKTSQVLLKELPSFTQTNSRAQETPRRKNFNDSKDDYFVEKMAVWKEASEIKQEICVSSLLKIAAFEESPYFHDQD